MRLTPQVLLFTLGAHDYHPGECAGLLKPPCHPPANSRHSGIAAVKRLARQQKRRAQYRLLCKKRCGKLSKTRRAT